MERGNPDVINFAIMGNTWAVLCFCRIAYISGIWWLFSTTVYLKISVAKSVLCSSSHLRLNLFYHGKNTLVIDD